MKLPSQADPQRLRILEIIIQNIKKPYISALEIGSYAGESAVHIAEAISKYAPKGGSLYCVDPWKPYFSIEDKTKNEHYKIMEQSLLNGEALSTFIKRVSAFMAKNYKVCIASRQGTLREVIEANPLFSPGTFDFIYIDGSHYYEDVKQDLEDAIMLCKPGGLICGDDLEKQFYETDPEVLIPVSYTVDNIYQCHPGVTRAVWETFGYVWCQNGVWVVKRQSW